MVELQALTSHLQLRQELLLWLIHLELLQDHVKVCALWKSYQASWSISIDLDTQHVRSFTQVFLWKTPFKQPFMLSRNSTSFPINNMSSIYTYQKCCSAPTHFLANTSFLQTLYKPKCFDHLIKAYVPTPRCLLQSIEGSLEFAYLLASLGSTKLFGCITYILSSWKPSRKLCFDIHLPDC